MIESVDNLRMAAELNRICGTIDRPKLKVLVQVNTSDEKQKYGIAPIECPYLVKHIVNQCKELEFAGLMTIGKTEGTPEEQEKCFEVLCGVRDALPSQHRPAEFVMSMGMSADFAVAMKLGSTSVRIGSSIFGPRTTLKLLGKANNNHKR